MTKNDEIKLEYMFYSGVENGLQYLKFGYQDTPKITKKQMLEQLEDAIDKAKSDREERQKKLEDLAKKSK